MSGRGALVEKLPTGFPNVELCRYAITPNWYGRFYQPNTRRYYLRSLETADQQRALKILPEIYTAFLQDPTALQEKRRKTVVELIDEWLVFNEERVKAGEITERTLQNKTSVMKNSVIPYLFEQQLLRVSDINPRKAFANYVSWKLKDGFKHSSVSCEIVMIKEWVRYLHKKGYVKDPTTDIRLPRQTHAKRVSEETRCESFTDHQINQIFDAFMEKIQNSHGFDQIRWKQVLYFCELMLVGGFRTDELYNLKFGDCLIKTHGSVQQTENLVKVRISKTGPRETFFASPVITNLKNFYMEMGVEVTPEMSLWYNTREQRNWSSQIFARQFRKILKGLNLDYHYRLYSYRHTHITQSIERGVSLYLLAKNLGTSESQIRKTYDHVLMRLQTKALLKDERDIREDTFESIV